ncbi:MAG: hypothetical protein ACI9EF_000864 [Pseudohongiellaceae bacterium]|jgi:hypothetical protein
MLQLAVPSLLALTLATTPAYAAVPDDVGGGGSYDILFSITANGSLASQVIEDEEVLLHRAAASTRLAWPGETLAALMGDPSDTGLHHHFGDLDAIHDPGKGGPGGEFLFSLSVNEQGYLDGDILGATDGGYELVISEADFLGAAGVDDGNLDVDAFHLYEDGSLLFSFAEDEASNLLSGDTAGVIADGDVLLLMAGSSLAQMLITESQINDLVSNALGSSASTGDTKGLAVDPFTGDILFSVQSPSAHDGSVFSAGAGGFLVPGHDELSLGFDGAIELDALSVALTTWPTLEVSEPTPQGGDSVAFSITGDVPGAAYVVLMSQSLDVVWSWQPGWGGVSLTQDAVFLTAINQLPMLTVVADGLGRASLPATVPVGLPALDMVFQAFDLGNIHFSSNPIVVELNQ